MAEWAESLGTSATVLWVLLGLLVAMGGGTVARLAALHRCPPEKRRARVGSLVAWWVFFAILAGVVLLGRGATIAIFAIASLQGMREFLRMTGPRHEGAGLRALAYLCVALHYLWILLGWTELARTFVPVFVFLLLPARLIVAGRAAGFVNAVSSVAWGLGLIAYCFSHVLMFFDLPNAVGGPAGWILFLVILTEAHDIAQALWGRRFGRHPMTPVLSPNKTWEGLALGTLSTLLLAALLAPMLTPLARGGLLGRPVIAGLLIAAAGVFGDLAMSAVKRDCGVKDSGALIPGQGGLLDRIDSLTFTAPLFYWFVAARYG